MYLQDWSDIFPPSSFKLYIQIIRRRGSKQEIRHSIIVMYKNRQNQFLDDFLPVVTAKMYFVGMLRWTYVNGSKTQHAYENGQYRVISFKKT